MRNLLILLFFLHSATWAQSQTGPTFKTVVLSQGKIKFRLKPDDREQYARSCPLGVCTCESDIEYLQFTGRTNLNALRLVNNQLRSDAYAVGCEYLDATDFAHQTVTHLSPRVVSVVEDFWSRQLDAGGSCHGSSAVHTFDWASGKEYLLGDIISGSSLPRLRSALPASFVAEENRQINDQLYEAFKQNLPFSGQSLKDYRPYVLPREDSERDSQVFQKALASLSDQQILALPLFIDKGRMYINLEGYYLSCAAGSFHPGEIPAPLITLPLIRQEIARQ